MMLNELKWERRSDCTFRAKVLLGDGHRLYIYNREYKPETTRYDVFVNSGVKSGPAVSIWQEVDQLTAQCVVHSAIEKYSLRPLPWWSKLWRYLWG
jgi:hypothetical protein